MESLEDFKRKKGFIKQLHNFWHSLLGNSGCPACGDAFDFHNWISIDYSPGRNMMPLCKECFERLSIDSILWHCEELVRMWRRDGSEKRWSDMRVNIKHRVEVMKEIEDAGKPKDGGK